jgi:hypothetical protein
MKEPEPCLKGRCWSPMACNGWGYCRDRNLADGPGQRPDGDQGDDVLIGRLMLGLR